MKATDGRRTRTASETRDGHVYFIQSEWKGLVRIGWTNGHPDARLKRIRATSAAPIAPIGMFRGGRDTEAALHQRFEEHWSHGEWFAPAPELLAFVGATCEPWPEPKTAFRRRLAMSPARPRPKVVVGSGDSA